jgi:hypothetical protein
MFAGEGVYIPMNIHDPALIEAVAALDRCDAYVVLVVDPETGEVDAHGTFDGLAATLIADQMAAELDAGGLAGVHVAITRLHRPTGRHRARGGDEQGPTTCVAPPNS